MTDNTRTPGAARHREFFVRVLLHTHARSHSEGGCDGGEHGDDDVQDFAPKVLVFHDSLIFDF